MAAKLWYHMAMTPALVILAAGMGSRYGGDKQLAQVGPDGSTISDYLVYDALRSGFGEIVMVVREAVREALAASLLQRFGTRARVRFVIQRLDDLPPGATPPPSRTKPWGTSHAVLTAARELKVPFGVVNADDLYGPAAFKALGDFLTAPQSPDTHALVGFPVKDTLSEHGTVNRGVCRVARNGWLDRIREVKGIEPHDGGAAYRDESGAVHVLPGDTPVSMNMWGFAPSIVPELARCFAEFITRQGQDTEAEYLLPGFVEDMVRGGHARVRVLTGPFKWWGVTYPADRPLVTKAIAELVAAGVYPERLS